MLTGSDMNRLFPLKIKLDDSSIERAHSAKSLRLFLDGRLTWTNDVDCLTKNVSCLIGALRQIGAPVTRPQTLTAIYKAVIQPLFDDCDVV